MIPFKKTAWFCSYAVAVSLSSALFSFQSKLKKNRAQTASLFAGGMLLVSAAFPILAADQVPAVTLPAIAGAKAVSADYIAREIDGKETPELIPDAAAIQMFSEMLSSLDKGTNQAALDFLQDSMLLTDNEFESLRHIALDGVSAAKSEKAVAMSALCQDAGFVSLYQDKRNIPQITQVLDNLGKDLENSREARFKGAVLSILGSNVHDSVMGWINSNLKPGIKIVEFDTTKRSALAGVDPQAAFLKNCTINPDDNSSANDNDFGNDKEEN